MRSTFGPREPGPQQGREPFSAGERCLKLVSVPQAAAEEAQNLHRQALSKVDLNAEVEKARADEKEGSLRLMEQEHESKVKELVQLGRPVGGKNRAVRHAW